MEKDGRIYIIVKITTETGHKTTQITIKYNIKQNK
jgi:hypothetical protein